MLERSRAEKKVVGAAPVTGADPTGLLMQASEEAAAIAAKALSEAEASRRAESLESSTPDMASALAQVR